MSVGANGTTAVGVACTSPEFDGDPRLLVLSGTKDEIELAGRAAVPWNMLTMPKKTGRRRFVEGIFVTWMVKDVDWRVEFRKFNDKFAPTSRVINAL